MPRRESIRVPPGLRPLLERPADWPETRAWRVSAAACRASGVVAWAARLAPPGGKPILLDGRSQSRPGIVQSECVDALIAALEVVPEQAAVEIIAPTSLRYLVEGAAFSAGSRERCLFELASRRRVWARYALGELEDPVAECLERAYACLAPLRWPGEAALEEDKYVLFADGGCTPYASAAAWVLRRGGTLVREHAWCLPGAIERDAVRLAEFLAASEGLDAVPTGSSVAVVTDHADVTDFGVRGVPAFRPSRRVATVLSALRERSAARDLRWYWAAREETAGQRRCQVLIDRQLRAATAWPRFAETCRAGGLQRVDVPDFDAWLAPREPLLRTGQPDEEWSATFEPRSRYLAADSASTRVYVRQIRLARDIGTSMHEAFGRSRAATWCDQLRPHPPVAGAAAAYFAQLRSQFLLLALLFEPSTAVLVQTRPGATLADVLAASAEIREVDLT